MAEKKKETEKTENGGTRKGIAWGAAWLGPAGRLCAVTAAFFARRLKEGLFPLRFLVFLTRLAVMLMIIVIGIRGLQNVKPLKKIAKHVTPIMSEEMSKPVDQRRMSVSFEYDGVKTKWGYSGWANDGSANPNRDKGIWGEPLNIHGTTFEKGIGTHAPSVIVFDLKGAKKPVAKFTCKAGIDSKAGPVASAVFKVFGDNQKLFESPVMRETDAAFSIQVILSGQQELKLEVDPVEPSASWDHADWVDIKFE